MGKGSVAPAIKKAIIELDLMAEFHWLPQDIKKIPYNDLQRFYIIRRQQRETEHQKQILQASAFGNQGGKSTKVMGRGQAKR